MRRLQILILIAIVAIGGFTTAAAAAPAQYVQGYLNIPGFTEGAGTVPGYTDFSEVLGFAFDVKGGSGGGSGASERPKFTLTITKPIDNATPRLMLAAAQGTTHRDAFLTFTKSGTGYSVKLWSVKITEVRQHYDALDPVQPGPGNLEDVTIRFGRITWKYNSVLTGWDLGRNREYIPPE